ncbi:hypothetical protein ACQEU8_20085 [Streptomyces sp. CA-250714]|uniref:hypothetical protein n=1 Tax=Streptomyces sp. CA-250714 TaxID=3240060 RepID=UPI003D950691
MGQFQGFDPAKVRELAGHLESVAGSIVPMHRRLTQILEAAATDVAPQKVSTSPEIEPLLNAGYTSSGVPEPMPAISRMGGYPTQYLPGPRTQSEALAAGPLPGSVDPFLRQTAADIRARCDRLEQVRQAAPPSARLDAGALLDAFADLNAVPKPNAGEQAIAKWWAGLTPGQRNQYLYLKPEALQTLKGLPADVLKQAAQLAYFKVVPYKTSSHESTGGTKLSLGILEIGEGFALRTEQMSDGTFRVTMINNGQGGIKVKTDEMTLGGGAKFELGDTWVFKSKADAEKLQKDLQEAFYLHRQLNGTNIFGVIEAKMRFPGVLERIGQPQIKITTKGVEANAELGAGAGTSGIKFSSNFSTITSTTDPQRPTVTESRDFVVDGSLALGDKVKVEHGRVVNGTIQVVRDKNNPDPNTNITTVRLIQTVEKTTSGAFSGELDGKGAGVSGSVKGGPTSAHVVTVNVPIGAAPEEQAAARKWLKTPPTTALVNPGVPADPPAPDADLFAKLAHSRAQVSDVSYKGSAGELKLGAKFTVNGIPIGFETSAGDKGDRVIGQRYLSAPDPETGKRKFVPIN